MPKTTSERRDVSYKLHETIYGVITVNIKWLLIFFLIGFECLRAPGKKELKIQ